MSTGRVVGGIVCGVAAILAVVGFATQAEADPASSRALLDTYCVGCHNQRTANAGIAFDTADVTQAGERPDIWERVIRKVRLGAMPPRGAPRPDASAAAAFVRFLKAEIDRAAAIRPNPGRVEAFHRLNRAEYQNAIRDLLAIDVDVAALLPADDSDRQGFDNVASTLSVSPTLLERYLTAARKISRLAVGLAPAGGDSVTYDGFPRELEDDRTLASEDLPFGSRGGLAVRHYFPADGEYTIAVKLRRTRYDYVMGLGNAHQLQIRLDGALVKSFTIGGNTALGSPAPIGFTGNVAGDPKWEDYAIRSVDADLRVRFPLTAGPHVVGVSFVARPTEDEGVALREPSITSPPEADDLFFTNPNVATVRIDGPLTESRASDTPSRRKLFVCRPPSTSASAGQVPGAPEEVCAKRILAAVARRAYRRPVTPEEVETLLGFFRAGRREEGVDAGIALSLQRVLVDPNFLFRIERDPTGVAPSANYRISDLDLASRLSFFLWSSLPDDELLEAAIRGRLRQPGVLVQQARRMFRDPRSKALMENFAGQWLQLRNIAGVKPDVRVFPEFDETLRQALRRETELFVEHTMREDRPLVELLTAGYTFVNERLARHYGIPNVYGERFRRVTLDVDGQRGGLLGHGSLLALTSYPTRTSPVVRGKWLLENILGAPPPPPPPNVPGLPDSGENKAASVRARLEQHRRNPICANCHAQMDPLGFALEHYDAIGKWRSADGGQPVDANGAFVNGAEFQGLAGLRTFVLGNREAFIETVTRKLLAYALGRELQVYDLPTVRNIQQLAAPRDYRWSSVIEGVVTSPAFLMRRSSPADEQSRVRP